jgi:hypothetical protein
MAADGAGAMVVTEMREEVGADLRGEVERLAVERGIDTEFLVVRGDPFTELRGVAQEVRADALVVGASERAGHRFVGSLAGRPGEGRPLACHGRAVPITAGRCLQDGGLAQDGLRRHADHVEEQRGSRIPECQVSPVLHRSRDHLWLA